MNILLLKWQQLKRIASLIPFPYHLALAILVFFVGYFIFVQLSKDPNGYFIVAIYGCLLLAYHQRRSDKMFIKSLYQNTFLLYLLDYAVASAPFFLLIVLSGNVKLIPLTVCGLLAIACAPQSSRISLLKLRYAVLFPHAYEWISGCRNSVVYLIVFYLISVLVLLKTFMGVFVYLFILLQCAHFYREGESVSLVCLPEKTAAAYIKGKVKTAIRNFHLVSLPFYLLFVAFHPSLWWVLVLLSVSAVTSFLFCICLKYANYVPDEKNSGHDLLLSLGVLAAFTPFLPLTFLLSIRYFFVARKNLNLYLDGYNH